MKEVHGEGLDQVSFRVVVAGQGNVEDSRCQDAFVTDPGIMQGIEERLGSTEKHSIWNW